MTPPTAAEVIAVLSDELLAWQTAFREGQMLELTQYGTGDLLAPLIITAMVSAGLWVLMPVPEFEGEQSLERARGNVPWPGDCVSEEGGEQVGNADRA